MSVNGAKPSSASVISGIPQGSILEPALFVIYITDILDNIAYGGLMFADDTNIFKSIASRNDAIILQSDMQKLENWSRTWVLDFNSDKCQVLTMEKFDDIMHAHRYTVYNQEMGHVFEEKCLIRC